MLLQSLLLAATVSAYPSSVKPGAPAISWMFPDGRNEVEGQYHVQPCGAGDNGVITDYPLTGGMMSFGQGSATDNVNFLVSKYVEAGKDDYEFKTFGSPTVADLSSGHFCANGPDLASLGFSAGQRATLMVMFQADGPPQKGFNKRWMFQCADINIVETSAWAEPSGFMCANLYEQNSTRITTAEQTMDLTVTKDVSVNPGRATAMNSSDMDPTKAGGIGAGVTVGVFLLALGALWATGLLRFGRKSVHIPDDSSSASSVPIKQRA